MTAFLDDGHQAAPLSAVFGKGCANASATPASLHSLAVCCKASKSLFQKSRVASIRGILHKGINKMEDAMPWTATSQPQYRRRNDCRQNDLTDEEWALIAPLLPEQGRMGRPRKTDPRRVFDAIQYMLGSGCQWRLIPDCYPAFSTVQNYF